ncbi:hypothetical protein RGUI_2805 [Rhodovulum sp. P5]|uniref:DUF6878 family protein n=1 Tax=Rhodovulum sp. P5 TaxID=1564506 RepID=UPI0009C3DFAD|nr:DUF6878 family protein [Rhodovulum sp. P5]ARE40946.1 hypothetical protein RGUI_2805 [Rhodovulum sp. P5]
MTDTTEQTAPAAPTPTFDFAKWEAEQRARNALLEIIRPKNKAAIFALLAEASIANVTVEFDGYGDSGSIESVHAEADGSEIALPDGSVALLTLGWRETEPTEKTMPLGEAIEHMVYELLGQTHGGWENNAGAYGEFVFNVAAATITLEFNMRFEDTEFFEHTF